MCLFIYIGAFTCRMFSRLLKASPTSMPREFAKGGLVKGGLAIRHVFDFRIKNGA